MMRITCRGEELVSNILEANRFWDRLVGLMFRSSPPKGSSGLLIDPCNSIHTCFMKYPLDVIFLDSSNRVVKIIYHLKPWRFTWIYFRAKKTLEVPSGTFKKILNIGDTVEITYV